MTDPEKCYCGSDDCPACFPLRRSSHIPDEAGPRPGTPAWDAFMARLGVFDVDRTDGPTPCFTLTRTDR